MQRERNRREPPWTASDRTPRTCERDSRAARGRAVVDCGRVCAAEGHDRWP